MSSLQSLFLLLVVAYLGGFLMGGRGVRGAGLPSGSEWLVLGAVAGPAALGVVSGAEVAAFAPLALLAVGWIALVVGLAFGTDRARRIPVGGIALGIAAGAASFAAVAGALHVLLAHVPAVAAALPDPAQRHVVVLGVAAALADTSRRLVRWAEVRLGADGPLLRRFADVALSDDLVPIVVLSALVSTDGSRGIAALPFGGLAVGAVLGVACALLLGRKLRATAFWSLLFGFSLVAVGASVQLDVSAAAATFALGLALALASPLRAEVRELSQGAVGAVVLPALFLAGARATVVTGPVLWIAAAAVAARIVVGLVLGLVVAAFSPSFRRGGPAVGLAFFAPGPLGVAVALAVNLRTPGLGGEVVLATTVAAAIAGEFLGPPALRHALGRAGELPATEPAEDEAAPPAAGTPPGGATAEGAP